MGLRRRPGGHETLQAMERHRFCNEKDNAETQRRSAGGGEEDRI